MSKEKNTSSQTDRASSNGQASASKDKPDCFVIMPISDPDGYESGHFGQVFDDLFVPACERAGYRAIRADQVRQTNLIHLDVLQKIVESPMALCDLSNRNPNVMFELGLRQAFDKPVVLVQEIGTPTIFDITPLRYTEYHREMLYRHVLEDQENITTAILATREAIKNSKSVNSIVKLLSITQAASLANVTDADKDTAFLQVIMAEISNLRAEVMESRTDRGRVKTIKRQAHDDAMLEAEISNVRSKLTELENDVFGFDSKSKPPAEARKKLERLETDIAFLSDYILTNVNDPIIIATLSKLERRVSDVRSYLKEL